jgi:DNA-binding XRE family transcriptional regulator
MNMAEKKRTETTPEEESYLQWREEFLSDPERRTIYEEEAAKSELWLQLVEARQEAGLTQQEMAERLGVSQAQVSRIEKEGYDAYTLNTLENMSQLWVRDTSLKSPFIHPTQKNQLVTCQHDTPAAE